MDRAEHIRALQAEYAQLQAQDRREAEARLREVLARDPEIGVLRTRGAAIALEAMREMMRQTDLEKRRQAAAAAAYGPGTAGGLSGGEASLRKVSGYGLYRRHPRPVL